METYENKMREPTKEERESIKEYIDHISMPTNINFYENETSNFATVVGKTKIKDGSRFTAGGKFAELNLMLDQHFNWFQKFMWKSCFGVKVEDYSDE